MGIRILIVLLAVPLFTGCGESTAPGVSKDEPIAVKALAGSPIVAFLTSFRSGVGAIAALSGDAFVELFPTSSDVALRRSGTAGTFYVLDRRGGAVTRHALASTKLERPFYRDRGANFQDIHEVSDGTWWLSALNREDIVRVNGKGEVVEQVSLRELAAVEAKGLAYPTYFWTVNGHTYLLLQRLKDGVHPSEKSYVVEVAAGKGLVGERHELSATNPYTDWIPAEPGCAYVGMAGETGMFSAMDGAIEKFCPGKERPWSLVAKERALKRDIYDFVPLPGEKFLCLSTSPKNELFLFDAKTHEASEAWVTGKGFQYVDLLEGGDRYFVADRDEKTPGLREIDLKSRKLFAPIPMPFEPLSLLWMK